MTAVCSAVRPSPLLICCLHEKPSATISVSLAVFADRRKQRLLGHRERGLHRLRPIAETARHAAAARLRSPPPPGRAPAPASSSPPPSSRTPSASNGRAAAPAPRWAAAAGRSACGPTSAATNSSNSSAFCGDVRASAVCDQRLRFVAQGEQARRLQPHQLDPARNKGMGGLDEPGGLATGVVHQPGLQESPAAAIGPLAGGRRQNVHAISGRRQHVGGGAQGLRPRNKD